MRGDLSIQHVRSSDLVEIEAKFPTPKLTSYKDKVARQTKHGYSFYKIELDGEIIAIGQIRREGPFDEKAKEYSSWPEISDIHVLEHMRKRGVASFFLKSVEQVLMDEGYTTVGLASDDTNTAANALYKKFNYVPIGDLPARSESRPSRHYYVKNLTK